MTQLSVSQQMEMNRLAQTTQFNSQLLALVREMSDKIDKQSKQISNLQAAVKKLNKEE